jgi:hypothetical protein
MDHGRLGRPDELLAPAGARDDRRFTAAGFRISVLSQPQPVPEARELDRDGFRMLSTNPGFLFFVLHAE